jgi:hypothetical protein
MQLSIGEGRQTIPVQDNVVDITAFMRFLFDNSTFPRFYSKLLQGKKINKDAETQSYAG